MSATGITWGNIHPVGTGTGSRCFRVEFYFNPSKSVLSKKRQPLPLFPLARYYHDTPQRTCPLSAHLDVCWCCNRKKWSKSTRERLHLGEGDKGTIAKHLPKKLEHVAFAFGIRESMPAAGYFATFRSTVIIAMTSRQFSCIFLYLYVYDVSTSTLL